jgi:hypothetical protein
MKNDGNLYYKAEGQVTPLGAVVEVILLGITPKQPFVNIRSYWEKNYDPGNTEPPVCMSQNGIKPHPFAPVPQAETCAACAWSQPGSGQKGGKTQKCRSTKIAAMVLANQPQMKPFIMHVPVTALKSLSQYISDAQTTEVDLGGEKFTLPLAVYKCQIVRDPEKTEFATPKFIFTGNYLQVEADCVYTTELACKLDKEEEIKQLTGDAVPDVPQIEGPATATPLVQPEIVVNPVTPPHVAVAPPVIPQAVAPPVVPQAVAPPVVPQAVTPPVQPATAKVEAPAVQYIQSLTHKSQLSAALDQISKWDKQTIASSLPLFVETANRLNGTIYDLNLHGNCGTTGLRSYPAITKGGDYKKKRGVTAPQPVAPQIPVAPPVQQPVAIQPTQAVAPPVQQPAVPVAPVAPPAQQAPVAPTVQQPAAPAVNGGGSEAIQRVLSGLQNLGT